ncbi:MAG: cytidine deaminase [Clostridia bacterium]|nr:cytidine deaminase [Clostridia bacterium]
MNDRELIGLALGARENAYCMYSGVAVGAALLADSGKIYLGANIENASFSPTVCAERVAFFEAVNKGERKFKKIAIAGGNWGKRPTSPFYPCGVCRQVMTEFCDENFEIIVSSGETYEKYTLKELMPHGFSRELF